MVHRARSLQPGRIRPGTHAGQPRLRRGTCRLLGLCLVAALAGPATPAGPDPPAPGRPAPAGHARLTATRADAGTAAGAARQAIRFRQPDGTSAGAADTPVGAPVTLQARASSGLPVSFRSATPLVCTVSGTIVTTVAAGVCTITASQAGNTQFAAAPDRARAFQIGTGQQQQEVSFPQPAGTQPGQPQTKVGEHVPLTASVTRNTSPNVRSRAPAPEPGPAISFRSDTPAVCTVSGIAGPPAADPATTIGEATAVSAGACTITATQPGDSAFAAAGVARTFQIGTGQQQQEVSFPQPPGRQVGARIPLTAKASSGLAVTFRSDTPAVCAVSASTITAGPVTTGSATAVSAGACTITATQPGDPPFRVALARTFQIGTGQTPQGITFRRPAGTRAGVMAGIPVTLSASASSRLEVSFRSTTPLACAVSGTTVLTLAPGRCAIIAAQEGSARFAAARDEHRSFMITAGQAVQSVGPASARSLPAVRTATLPVGTAVRVPVTATSGLAVTLQATTGPGTQFPPACVVSGLTVITLAAGQCTVTAAQGGSQEFGPATASFPLTVVSKDGQPQSIGGFSVPARAMVGVPFVVSAQAKSGLAVSFRAGPAQAPPDSGTPPGCTVSGATVIPLTAGPCTVTAFQAGSFQPPGLKASGSAQSNVGYQAAVPATRSIQVQQTQTIRFTQPGSALAGVAVPLSATASSGLPVSFRSGTPDVCAVSGSTVTPRAAGLCAITASQDGNTDYAAAPDITRSFRVKATQSITFTQPGSAAAGVTVPLSATASSGLPVSFHSATPGVCTVTAATARTLAAGTCIIAATQGGNADYAAAPGTARSFTVHAGSRPQTIMFRQPPGTVVGRPVVLSARATSQLPVSLRSDTRLVCTVSGTTVTALAAGMCTITASQGGNAIFRAAPEMARSLEIQAGPQPQQIHFTAPSATRAGARVPLVATATSGLPVAFRSGSLPVCTVSGTTATAVAAGLCTVIATQGGSDLYTAAPAVQRSFQVTAGKVAQKITFAQPAGAGTGAAVTLIATASSGLPVSFRADTQDCAVSGATVITVAAGACTVTATQGGNRVYAAARGVARTFPVRAGKQPQHITFGPPPDTPAGVPVTPAAVASSGLPVSFRSGSPAVCRASGTAVIPLAAGTCTITARQGGNTVYAPAQDATQSFRILAGLKAQTITFTPPAATPVGVPVTLTASASSGLPVSFSSGTPAVCSVSGATVTTLTPGTCSITATQGGSSTYAAARATRSLAVQAGRRAQWISFGIPPAARVGQPVVLTASASSGLPVSFWSGTPAVCSVSGATVTTLTPGTCSIAATQGGSTIYAAARPAGWSFPVSAAGPAISRAMIGLLAAAALAAAGGVLALRRRWPRLWQRGHPAAAGPSVRAAANPGPPGSARSRTTGGAAAHTVRINAHPGASTTMIKESPHGSTASPPGDRS